MKKLLIIAALLVGTPAIAQDATIAPGKIVFFRGGSVIGAAVGCPIRYQGNEIVELGRGKFAEWNVPAGRYVFLNKTSSLEVSVFPGETRYVRCALKPGILSSRADLRISDEGDFKGAGELERKEITQ